MRDRNGQAGQSLVFVALGMVVLIGILGLAIDIGYYRYVRRELQTAADAAALAGAMDLSYLDVTTAAQAASSENGFANGSNGVTVTVFNPPHNGPYASSNYPTYVEAVVTQTNVPQFFSKVLGLRPITLSASAVAAGGINCIYGLDTNAGALTVVFTLVQSSCGVVDNDNLDLFVAALCAPSIQLKGSQTPFGFACGAGFRQVKPVKITTAVPDPLANIPAPGYSTPTPCPGGGTTVLSITTANVATYNPLTPASAAGHCGGVKITGIPASTNFRVQPGTYYGTFSGTSGTDAVFTIINSSVTFNSGSYDLYNTNTITSSNPSPWGIRVNSGFFGQSQVNFQAGNYNIVGGITDGGPGFVGSFINFNSTAGASNTIILNGGGLNLVGNSGTAGTAGQSSGGVTFYNTGAANPSFVATKYGPINSYFDFSAGFCGARCTLQAPTSGPLAGILFFQDRANASPATFAGDLNLNQGRGLIAHTGAYYFADATVNFHFDFGAGAPYTLLVAKDVSWVFNFTFNNDFANLPNGSPLRQGTAQIVQ
jgi:Putative Flp pilus-assembly TadE/G-like